MLAFPNIPGGPPIGLIAEIVPSALLVVSPFVALLPAVDSTSSGFTSSGLFSSSFSSFSGALSTGVVPSSMSESVVVD